MMELPKRHATPLEGQPARPHRLNIKKSRHLQVQATVPVTLGGECKYPRTSVKAPEMAYSDADRSKSDFKFVTMRL